jgi:hypothetical protein
VKAWETKGNNIMRIWQPAARYILGPNTLLLRQEDVRDLTQLMGRMLIHKVGRVDARVPHAGQFVRCERLMQDRVQRGLTLLRAREAR